MRWLSLLFIVLALGCILEFTHAEGSEGLSERETVAMGYCWSARRGLAASSSFHGVSRFVWLCRLQLIAQRSSFQESLDSVRAGCLISWFLVNLRRAPEAWLMISTGPFTRQRGTVDHLTPFALSHPPSAGTGDARRRTSMGAGRERDRDTAVRVNSSPLRA